VRTGSQQTGDAAERLVAERLRAAGWTILGLNVHVGRAELDIVAIDPVPPARLVVVILLVALFYLQLFNSFLSPRISQYKGLRVNLSLPGAEIIARDSSPLGRLDVLRSPAFHYAPGLSFATQPTPPEQLGLFVDAELAGAITRFRGDVSEVDFLDWTSSALPYHVLGPQADTKRVLIVGAGGGADVLLALYHKAERVEALELDPRIVRLVRDTFADFTGGLYRLPQVRLHAREARGFFEALSAEERYDLIQISLLDSFAASSAGVHALNESYLYTVEAFARFFDHLSPDGFLAITRWVKSPPRDNIKVFATAVAALEARGIAEPAAHLAMVRSWATATTLIKRAPRRRRPEGRRNTATSARR